MCIHTSIQNHNKSVFKSQKNIKNKIVFKGTRKQWKIMKIKNMP
jgi:hypothetical protein